MLSLIRLERSLKPATGVKYSTKAAENFLLLIIHCYVNFSKAETHFCKKKLCIKVIHLKPKVKIFFWIILKILQMILIFRLSPNVSLFKI